MLYRISQKLYHKRSVVAQRQQPQTQTMQNVHHPSHTSILSERHQPLTVGIHQLFIVNQTDVLLQNGVEQWHVGLLRLDRVREHAIGLTRDQAVDGHLLDTENDGRFADVLLDDGARIQKLLKLQIFDIVTHRLS
jgi:hypothetical protein